MIRAYYILRSKILEFSKKALDLNEKKIKDIQDYEKYIEWAIRDMTKIIELKYDNEGWIQYMKEKKQEMRYCIQKREEENSEYEEGRNKSIKIIFLTFNEIQKYKKEPFCQKHKDYPLLNKLEKECQNSIQIKNPQRLLFAPKSL